MPRCWTWLMHWATLVCQGPLPLSSLRWIPIFVIFASLLLQFVLGQCSPSVNPGTTQYSTCCGMHGDWNSQDWKMMDNIAGVLFPPLRCCLSFSSPANSAIQYALVVAPYHMTKPVQSEYVRCPLLSSSSSFPPSSLVTLFFQDMPSMLLVAICVINRLRYAWIIVKILIIYCSQLTYPQNVAVQSWNSSC